MDPESSKTSNVPREELLDRVGVAAMLALLNASTQIVTRTEQVLRDNDSALSAREWDTLGLLAALGPIRPSQLLRRTALTASPQTLSSLLDRLEAKELVNRTAHPSDARSVQVSVTEKGSQTAAELFPILARKVIGPFEAHFSEEEQATLLELLGRI